MPTEPQDLFLQVLSVKEINLPKTQPFHQIHCVVQVFENGQDKTSPFSNGPVGKIFAKAWLHCHPDTIRDYINEHNPSNDSQTLLLKVERFNARRNGLLAPTGLLKLFFNKIRVPTLPDCIFVKRIRYNVAPFVPQPRGCDRC